MTEEQRKQIIEERAKDICLRFINLGEPYRSNIWKEELHKEFYTDQAIEQLDWFFAHGLDIPEKFVEAKIPDNPINCSNGKASMHKIGAHAGFNAGLDIYEQANLNGLYTKEVK